MEELYIKALSENLGGSIKYARYAYEFLKDYFESHPIESLEIVSGRDFQEFAQDMSDINDFYYSAYYSLYDYVHNIPPYGDGEWLFEALLLTYIDVYCQENFDLTDAKFKKGDRISTKGNGFIEFVVPDGNGDFCYYMLNDDGDYEPYIYNEEDSEFYEIM